MKVLFLGNDANPMSVAALHALLESRAFDVTVGVYDGRGASTRGTALRLWRERGARVLARRIGAVLVARARVRLRAAGVRLRGYRSISELLVAYRPPHIACDRVNAPESLKAVKALEPDVIAMTNFGQILKRRLISVPGRGCVNVHPSLLPRYRGPSPFYWMLHNRERAAGVTVHYVDTGIDSGDIIRQRSYPIAASDTEVTLRDRAAEVGAGLLVETLREIESGTAPRIKQNGEATYFPFPPRGRSAL